jgi:hypothetical protein
MDWSVTGLSVTDGCLGRSGDKFNIARTTTAQWSILITIRNREQKEGGPAARAGSPFRPRVIFRGRIPHDPADPVQKKPLRLGATEHRSTVRTGRCQAQPIQYRMAWLCVANKNNHLCGNDQKERDLAYGDLCLRLHPP